MSGTINPKRHLLLILTIPLWFVALLMVATRPDGIGTDTANYRFYFIKAASSDWSSNLEIGFDYLLRFIATLTDRPEVFFGVIFCAVAFFMMKAMSLATDEVLERHKVALPVLCLGLLTASSWFNVATLNGIRQGISLSILFFAIHLIGIKKRILGGLFIVLALSFHDSTLFAVAALAILLLSARWVFVIFYASAILYAAGVYERIVAVFSELSGVGLHETIIEYANGVDAWRGVQFDLLAYTVFWPTLYLIASFFARTEYRNDLYRSISIYCALCMPYFILGFGSYSNRFAVMGWLYLPVLHVVFLVSARLTVPAATVLSFVILAFGLTKYFGLFFGNIQI